MAGIVFPLAGGVILFPFTSGSGISGASVRMISAANPAEAVLVVRFNFPMSQDAVMQALENWSVTPADAQAVPITLTAIVLNQSYPEMALLRYVGGGGNYIVKATGLTAASGAPLSPAHNSQPVTIDRPGDVVPTVRLFDTVWGPVGVAQRTISRRTIDQLVINRAIAGAVQIQLQQRIAATDGTSSGTLPGSGRTG